MQQLCDNELQWLWKVLERSNCVPLSSHRPGHNTASRHPWSNVLQTGENLNWSHSHQMILIITRKEKKLFDKSRMCPDHPRCATPTKVVMLGGVPNVVNHARFHPNRFMGFGSLRGRNLPFSYAWSCGLYNRLGLPPDLWLDRSARQNAINLN